MTRASHGAYRDPLTLIWLRCAAELGFRVTRSDEVYASWNGRGVLTLCTEAAFDEDDSLAQMILHEICHALIEGPSSVRKVDWGLDPDDESRGRQAEYACHRLQAALLDRYGLRKLMSVTTDWRPYWDALPVDPLADVQDPAVQRARDAWPEAVRGPWSSAIDTALRATADLADVTRPLAPPTSLWHKTRARHPLGEAIHHEGGCGQCAWSYASGKHHHCQHHTDGEDLGPAISLEWPACLRYEPRLEQSSCETCGACCREGFHVVGVDANEPATTAAPELLQSSEDGLFMPRPGGRCAALECRDGPPWRCSIYPSRPRACADFELGGTHCLAARRRVGLSRS